MKRQIYFYISLIVVITIITQIIQVYANSIVPVPIEDPGLRIGILILLFVFGIFIEYGLLNLKDETNQLIKQDLFIPVLKANLVTFPLTQILAYVVYIYFISFFWLYILAIEIAVILIEWSLLKIQLKKKFDHIASKTILLNMVKVNFISFLVGLIAFLPVFSIPFHLFY